MRPGRAAHDAGSCVTRNSPCGLEKVPGTTLVPRIDWSRQRRDIFGEIHVALDEANIDQFTQVLQRFLEWAQSIIVTHSNRTMTCASTIYGVTMQESGISKQVSVRFEDVSENGEIRVNAGGSRNPLQAMLDRGTIPLLRAVLPERTRKNKHIRLGTLNSRSACVSYVTASPHPISGSTLRAWRRGDVGGGAGGTMWSARFASMVTRFAVILATFTRSGNLCPTP
jgi:hypothetical protein